MVSIIAYPTKFPSSFPCLYVFANRKRNTIKVGFSVNLANRYATDYKPRLHCLAYAGPIENLRHSEKELLTYFRARFKSVRTSMRCEWFHGGELEAFDAFSDFITLQIKG